VAYFGNFQGGTQVALFDGDTEHKGDINITSHNINVNSGDINVTSGDINLTSGNINVTSGGDVILADCAEHFDVLGGEEIVPGTVMAIDRDEALVPSYQPYDKKVAGIVSGAGQYRSAITLDNRPSQQGCLKIALMGKVYCKVDASYSPIEIGDLLTTSATRGHAMKACDQVLRGCHWQSIATVERRARADSGSDCFAVGCHECESEAISSTGFRFNPWNPFTPAGRSSKDKRQVLDAACLHNVFLENMLSVGTVHCPSARVYIQGDGGWFFGGHLDDNAEIVGDNYAIGFVFQSEPQTPLGFATGELGSKITSAPQHIDFRIGGRDEWVQRNYFRAIADGVHFELHASDDVSGLFTDLVDDFKRALNQIEVVFKLQTNGAPNPGPDQGPTTPPNDGPGGEG
jgi:hypothetical protein